VEQEIFKLKGETAKPKIKPSKMDEGSSAENSDENGDDGDKRSVTGFVTPSLTFCKSVRSNNERFPMFSDIRNPVATNTLYRGLSCKV